MKKERILLIISLLFLMGFSSSGVSTSGVSGGEGGDGCDLSSTLKQETQNDFWYGQYQSQKLKISTSTTVCKVELYLLGNDAGLTGTVEFWSTLDRTGTQYGSTSATANIANDNAYHWVEFTFSSNPVLTTDCYLHFVGSAYTTVLRWGLNTSNTSYENTDYDYARSADENYDACFRIYEE